MKKIAAILFVGFLLRILLITSSPPSLYGDELTITLDSYSLLKTGRDQLGNFMPLTFPMGAGRPAGYVYGSIPFVAILGPTALGIRALSILSGMGIIILLYFIGRKLFSQRLGLVAAAIGAVSPWDISLSRGGFEAHFALFLVLLGTYLFIKAREKPVFYLFSALSFGLTLHTYPTYKVSLLLFLPLLFWYESKTKEVFKKKYFLLGAAVLIILGSLALSQTFIASSEKRFSNINIFSQQRDLIEQKINFERQISDLPETVKKYFHNKPSEYTKVFIENYLQNFSIDFLVLHGDRNPRHNMATMGELYFIEIVLIFIGFFSFWQRQKKMMIFLILWVLLAPVPTAMVDLPHVLRSSFMLPPLIILSALGLVTVLNYKNKKILSLVFFLFLIQFVFFIQKLFFLAPNEYSNFWAYSAKLASEIAIENKDKYDHIIISDKIDAVEFAYPVYAKVDPRQIIVQNNQKASLLDYQLKKFDNVYVGYIPSNEINKLIQGLGSSVLYISSKSDVNFIEGPEIISGLDGLVVLAIKKVGI